MKIYYLLQITKVTVFSKLNTASIFDSNGYIVVPHIEIELNQKETLLLFFFF
jgi:hypothetical protein